jgi:MFS family permease
MGSWTDAARRLAGERQPLFAVILAFTFGFAANGAIYASNVAQHELGAAGWQIGLSTAAQALGIVLAAPLMWLLSRSPRPVNAPVLACAVAAAGFLAVTAHEHWAFVALARFAFGCGLGLGVAHAEYTAIAKVRSDIRPMMVGMFGLAIAAGHMMGTLIAESLGLWFIRLAVCGLILGCALLTWDRGKVSTMTMPASITEVARIMKLMPVTFAAPLLFGFFDNGFLAMLPSYAMGLGLSAADVTSMSFWAFAGVLALQLPAAILCTRFDTTVILRASVIAAIAVIMALSMTIGVPGFRLVLAFILGGIIDVFYTVGLVAIANRLPRQQLAVGNACFVSLCGAGEVAGPIVTGELISWFGPQACFGVLAMLLAVYWFCSALSRETAGIAVAEPEPPLGSSNRRAPEATRATAAGNGLAFSSSSEPRNAIVPVALPAST